MSILPLFGLPASSKTDMLRSKKSLVQAFVFAILCNELKSASFVAGRGIGTRGDKTGFSAIMYSFCRLAQIVTAQLSSTLFKTARSAFGLRIPKRLLLVAPEQCLRHGVSTSVFFTRRAHFGQNQMGASGIDFVRIIE